MTCLQQIMVALQDAKPDSHFTKKQSMGKGGVHADQEGFLILEGRGKALFGDQEFDVYPGLTMIAPAGTTHSIKRDADSVPVKVFWFHSAV